MQVHPAYAQMLGYSEDELVALHQSLLEAIETKTDTKNGGCTRL